MIIKERLEELKKENAFVFYILNNSVQVIRVDENYNISTDEKINNGEPTLFYKRNNVFQDICEMKKVFEKEEDAKWYLDNTFERIERLKLPTWEEFYNHSKTIDNYHILFTDKDKERIELCICGNIDEADPENIVIFNLDNDIDQSYLFDKLANEENYKEACKLCGKLFEGEE